MFIVMLWQSKTMLIKSPYMSLFKVVVVKFNKLII